MDVDLECQDLGRDVSRSGKVEDRIPGGIDGDIADGNGIVERYACRGREGHDPDHHIPQSNLP